MRRSARAPAWWKSTLAWSTKAQAGATGPAAGAWMRVAEKSVLVARLEKGPFQIDQKEGVPNVVTVCGNCWSL